MKYTKEEIYGIYSIIYEQSKECGLFMVKKGNANEKSITSIRGNIAFCSWHIPNNTAYYYSLSIYIIVHLGRHQHGIISIIKRRMKHSEEKIKEIVGSMQTILALANMIEMEWWQLMPEFKTKLGGINQRCKRLKEDANAIKQHCYTLVKYKEEKDYVDIEHPAELYRSIKLMATIHTPNLREFNDKLEALPTIEIKDLID